MCSHDVNSTTQVHTNQFCYTEQHLNSDCFKEMSDFGTTKLLNSDIITLLVDFM